MPDLVANSFTASDVRAAALRLLADLGADVVRKAFEEAKHKRDHGKFSSTGGSSATAAHPTRTHAAPAGDAADAHATSLLAHIARVPRAIRERVTGFVTKRYRKLAERYGERGAKAILGACVLLSPLPIPGSSLIPIALAEAVVRIRRAIVGRAVMKAVSKIAHGIPDDVIQREAASLLADLHAECGEEPPVAKACEPAGMSALTGSDGGFLVGAAARKRRKKKRSKPGSAQAGGGA